MTQPNLGISLFVATRELEQRAFNAVAAAGYGDITLAQARVLSRVNDDGSRLGDLAEAARVSKQTATHLVAELVASGYLTVEPDPADRRAKLAKLTKKSRTVAKIAGAEVARIEHQWRELLGPAQYEQLVDTLHDLRTAIDPYLSVGSQPTPSVARK